MRLLIIVLSIALMVAVLGFIVNNLDADARVKILGTEYPAVPIYLIVLAALFAGICYAGLIAVAEGAHIRLANRRMSREIRRLETEINYLRTQPVGRSRPEPDTLPERRGPASRDLGESIDRDDDDLPRAPVYDRSTDEPSPGDDDDDIYSGGRAV